MLFGLYKDSSQRISLKTLNNEIIDKFCVILSLEMGLSENTINAYRSDLIDFMHWLGRSSTPIQSLDKKALEQFLTDGCDALRTSTVNRRVSAVKKFFSWLGLAPSLHVIRLTQMRKQPVCCMPGLSPH